jgi:hypothetical protein
MRIPILDGHTLSTRERAPKASAVRSGRLRPNHAPSGYERKVRRVGTRRELPPRDEESHWKQEEDETKAVRAARQAALGPRPIRRLSPYPAVCSQAPEVVEPAGVVDLTTGPDKQDDLRAAGAGPSQGHEDDRGNLPCSPARPHANEDLIFWNPAGGIDLSALGYVEPSSSLSVCSACATKGSPLRRGLRA